jgi:reactive chlorine resistance protein C
MFPGRIDCETFSFIPSLTRAAISTIQEGLMDTSADELIALSYRSLRAQLKPETLGAWIMRYGLVVVFLLIGSLKFTAAEATGIQPLVVHSPLMSWMYAVLSVQSVSNLIGVIEIVIAILLALRPISARASFVGSVGSVVTFLLTTSFLLSTPGAIQLTHGLPVLGDAGQFLIKDVVLLGASFWTAAEALAAV